MKYRFILAMVVLFSVNLEARTCGGNFNSWMGSLKKEALQKGVSQSVIDRALKNVTRDPAVIKHDRAQGNFTHSFLKFANRTVSAYRLKVGKSKMKKLASTFSRIERKYGVPKEVMTAFWAMETDFGANTGNSSTIRSLATLAHDCRRPHLFRPQLIAALKIVQRGDMPLSQMRGAWAGEIGQTQLLPSDYLEKGVDFNGDGRVDLRNTPADALATSARVIAAMGWRRGQPWLVEVKVPAEMPWDQADLKIKHSNAQWSKWGVRKRNGGGLSGGSRASLLLPMGRNGPAFLAYRNFSIYTEWNKSLVYATSAAYFATRLAGAPKVSNGRGNINALTAGEKRQVQSLLKKRGYNVGKVDGVLGAGTRASVKAMQKKMGLPADSYPDKAFLRKLKSS